MTVNQFFDRWLGKGLDYDSAYGFQCVDVFKQYNKDVVGGTPCSGNAKDYWTKYPVDFYTRELNTTTAIPQLGDVMIWGTAVGPYGHISVCKEANVNSFTSFDQNWPTNVDSKGNGLGVCHFQSHNYNGVLGWLRPEKLPEDPVVTPPAPEINDQTKIDLGEKLGVLEVQAIRSQILDLKQTIVNMNTEETGFKTQISEMIKSRQTLAEKLACKDDFAIIIAEVQKLIEKEDQLNGVTENPVDNFISALLNLFRKR